MTRQIMADPYTIRTRSGSFLSFENPNPDDIHLEDIAVALSRAPRFNGHTGPFYSVAQHSVFVARLMPPEHQLKGLLHDGSEGYLADVPTPAKRLMPDYYALESKVMAAIARRFGLEEGFQNHEEVVKADRAMLFMERDQMIDDTISWSNEEDHPGTSLTELFPMWRPWTPEEAASSFYNNVLARI